MKELVRLLQCEFLKLKRKNLFKFFLIIALFFPIFNSVLISDQNLADMMIGNREDSGFLLLIPFLVMMATQLFFEEYDNRTLKNILLIPVERRKIVLSKLFFLLLISVLYELFGYIATILIAYILGVALEGLGLHFFLTFLTGIFIWSAALPCIIVTIYFNKSYIISFMIAFFYTLLGFVFHLSDAIMMKPIGINLGTLLPVPVILNGYINIMYRKAR